LLVLAYSSNITFTNSYGTVTDTGGNTWTFVAEKNSGLGPTSPMPVAGFWYCIPNTSGVITVTMTTTQSFSPGFKFVLAFAIYSFTGRPSGAVAYQVSQLFNQTGSGSFTATLGSYTPPNQGYLALYAGGGDYPVDQSGLAPTMQTLAYTTPYTQNASSGNWPPLTASYQIQTTAVNVAASVQYMKELAYNIPALIIVLPIAINDYTLTLMDSITTVFTETYNKTVHRSTSNFSDTVGLTESFHWSLTPAVLTDSFTLVDSLLAIPSKQAIFLDGIFLLDILGSGQARSLNLLDTITLVESLHQSSPPLFEHINLIETMTFSLSRTLDDPTSVYESFQKSQKKSVAFNDPPYDTFGYKGRSS
jgi:uncharacterized membrane protein